MTDIGVVSDLNAELDSFYYVGPIAFKTKTGDIEFVVCFLGVMMMVIASRKFCT